MIKVNLLKNRGEATNATASTQINYQTSFETAVKDGGGDSNRSEQVQKVIFMLLAVGVLMTYEYFHISGLKSQAATLNMQKKSLQDEIKQKQPLANKAKELQKNIQDLESRIKIIKDLSRTRLREIKAVDYLQNVIPDKVWLTKVEFKEDQLTILGATLSDDELNKFIESMEGKSYFKNVILLKAVEQKSKEGTIKTFELSSSLVAAE